MNELVPQGLQTVPAPPTEAADLTIPGSMPLSDPKMERFARERALLEPRGFAYRKAVGKENYPYHAARGNAARWERRADVQARIAYFCRSDESLLQEKIRRLEEFLWLAHDVDIAEMWETVEVERHDRKGNILRGEDGKPLMKKIQRARPLDQIPDEVRRAIEQITVNEAGVVVPKPYSKMQANAELRKLLGVGSVVRDDGELARLSDAELIAQLAAQARELGINVDLTYRFGDAG